MKARAFWGLRPWKRHSRILATAGVLFLLYGTSLIVQRPSRMRFESLEPLLRIAPLQFWGGAFIFAGVLSMISSRWPPFAETWGYMVLTGLSFAWGAAYLTSMVFLNAPWTNLRAWLLWSVIGYLFLSVSGLRNPDEIPGVSKNADSRRG